MSEEGRALLTDYEQKMLKELKSRFGSVEINTTGVYIIGVLIITAAISLIMSRVIADELQTLETKQREVELRYELPDLVVAMESRTPNPHR